MNEQAHFLQLFLKHQTDIKAFIRSVVPRAQDADDLLQETALVCWEKFDRFDKSRSFGAWARGIASKKILQRRDQNRRLPTPFSAEAIEAVAVAFDRSPSSTGSEQAEALEQCLGGLQERSRYLLKLRYAESLRVDQIAERAEMQPAAAHKALSRIRKQLQECVQRKLAATAERKSGGAKP